MHMKKYLLIIGLLCYATYVLCGEDDDEEKEETSKEEEEDDDEEDDDDDEDDFIASKPKGPAKEWGSHIAWIEDVDEGLERAKKVNKPIMMIVHRTWCHACKALAPKFAQSPGIAALSKHFVMLSISGDQEPWQEEYQPNGIRYVPRVHFIEPDGKLIADIQNKDKSYEKGYEYFFPKTSYIVKAMKQVLKRYKVEGVDEVDENAEADGKDKGETVREKREL